MLYISTLIKTSSIFYNFIHGNVYIDYILDCRRDYGWLFNERIAMPFGKTDKKAS